MCQVSKLSSLESQTAFGEKTVARAATAIKSGFPLLRILVSIIALAGLCAADEPVKPISQYVHNVWRTEEGLPQNSVQAILQTKDGYLWLGTQEGLVRFNGTQFISFNKTNVDAIKHNDVRALLEAHDGNLWIGTIGGVVVRDHSGQFRAYTQNEGLSNNFVNALLEDEKGSIWVATNDGLNRFTAGKFVRVGEHAGLSNTNINALVEDRNHDIWAGTNGGLNRISQDTLGKNSVQTYLPGRVITSLYVDHAGVVWVGTARQGLYAFRGGDLVHYGAQEGVPKAPILSIIQDERNFLWIGTSAGGICRSTAATPAIHLECYTSREGLSGDTVMALFEDREKSIWAGTETGGLNRFKDGLITTYGAAAGFNGTVRSIDEDQDRTLWVALDNGLRRFKNGKVLKYLTGNGPANNYAWTLTVDHGGKVWVGTNGGGLNVFSQDGVKTYTTKDGLADNQIHAIFQDHDGNMWIGTERNGVSLFANGKFQTYNTQNGLSNNRVWTILEDHNQRLWFGTDSGLSRLDKDRKTFTTIGLEEKPNAAIMGGPTAIYEDSDHILWISTYGGGLKRLDENGKLTTYGRREGLFDDNVWAVLEDDQGNFWMSSNLGIFRVKKSELTAFAEGKIFKIHSISYGVSDGMADIECNGGSQNSGQKTSSGTLLFACVRGMVAVTPSLLTTNSLPPPVVIEQAQINGIDITGGEKPTAVGRGELEFHFAGLSYLAPEKVTFKYKLEGFDKDWISAGTRHVAYYTNIPHGHYKFLVIAANNDGVWNTTGAQIGFYLAPRFYQTFVFYAGSILLLLITGMSGFVLRVRSLRRREEELRSMVSERTRELQDEILERNKIEQDLYHAKEVAEAATRSKSEFLANMSHEIRTPLNGVIGMMELTRQTQLTEEQHEFLSMAGDSATTLLAVINDILDFSKIEAGKLELDREEFDLGELIAETLRTVTLRAHQKHIELTCWMASDLPKWFIGDSVHLRQVLINLLGNAIKFTEKGEVGLRVESAGGEADKIKVRFAVSDTGVGIPEDKRKVIFEAFSQADSSVTRKFGGTGLGLAICSRIIAAMGGEIQVDGNGNKGAVFSFSAIFNVSLKHNVESGMPGKAELKGARTLIVDDNLTNRRILEGMLASWGMLTHAVDSGKAALQAMNEAAEKNSPFSLVLADYCMPEMDGFELIKQIRSRPEFSPATLMMLTSDDYHGTASRCRELGIKAYLIKPIRSSDLLSSIRKLLMNDQPDEAPVFLRTESQQRHKGLKILLAEDNVVNQRLAVRLLQKMEHTVAVAQSGAEALAKLAEENFDLVLMDVQMPEMDGLTASGMIRKKERQTGHHMPIIAMTAHALKGDRERCLASGMDGYISKPINGAELLKTIDETLDSLLLLRRV
jgi:signal transduction histidine kinase/ligand-binding sensor domain-containing protein/CheY-like chemotaxis protein